MDFQPKAKADTAFELFPDGRASRPEIAGTIARGQLLLIDDERSNDGIVASPSAHRVQRGPQ